MYKNVPFLAKNLWNLATGNRVACSDLNSRDGFHSIANVQSLSSTLDGDGGIAAPKKYCPMILQFQKGWVNFLPFFLPVQLVVGEIGELN